MMAFDFSSRWGVVDELCRRLLVMCSASLMVFICLVIEFVQLLLHKEFYTFINNIEKLAGFPDAA